MKPDAKKPGILYLSVFLFLTCAVAAAVMAVAAKMTEKPILERQQNRIAEALVQVLPPFDTVEQKEVQSKDGVPASLFTVRKDGRIAGYAVQTSTQKGYGGTILALTGFDPDGSIHRIVVIQHAETPGIGTKVVSREMIRTVSSLFRTEPPEPADSVPANEALDSYNGKNAALFVPAEGGASAPRPDVHFVTGATISSLAVLDLETRASEILKNNVPEVR